MNSRSSERMSLTLRTTLSVFRLGSSLTIVWTRDRSWLKPSRRSRYLKSCLSLKCVNTLANIGQVETAVAAFDERDINGDVFDHVFESRTAVQLGRHLRHIAKIIPTRIRAWNLCMQVDVAVREDDLNNVFVSSFVDEEEAE